MPCLISFSPNDYHPTSSTGDIQHQPPHLFRNSNGNSSPHNIKVSEQMQLKTYSVVHTWWRHSRRIFFCQVEMYHWQPMCWQAAYLGHWKFTDGDGQDRNTHIKPTVRSYQFATNTKQFQVPCVAICPAGWPKQDDSKKDSLLRFMVALVWTPWISRMDSCYDTPGISSYHKSLQCIVHQAA